MDENQVEVPQSFIALYSRNGRPFESRPAIEERYDLCEDIATQTSEACHVLQFRDDLSEGDVLLRCRASLRDGGTVTVAEADWIVVRVAELLQWKCPDLAVGGRDAEIPG